MNALNQDIQEWEERHARGDDVRERMDALDRIKALRSREMDIRRQLASGRCTVTETEQLERDLQICQDAQDAAAAGLLPPEVQQPSYAGLGETPDPEFEGLGQITSPPPGPPAIPNAGGILPQELTEDA